MNIPRGALGAMLSLLILAACSVGPTTPKAKASPSPAASATPTVAPSPAPVALPAGFNCPGDRHTPSMVLAGDKLWNSVTPSAPVLLCTFTGAVQLQFVSANVISYIGADRGQIVELNLDSGALTSIPLATAPRSIATYAWSPDGKGLAYWLFTDSVTGGGNNNAYQGFLKTGSGDPRKITEETPVPGRGVGPADNISIHWSPTGGFVAMVNTFFNAPHLQIFRPDATSAFPGLGEEVRGPVMAGWGPNDTLYFSDEKSLRTWAPPDSINSVGGANLYYPTVCPGGCAVAYTVMDTASGGPPKVHVQSIAAGNSDANLRAVGAFVVTGHLWYYAEEANPAGGLAPPYRMNGKVYDYNIQTKLEAELPLSVAASETVSAPSITDIWPRS